VSKTALQRWRERVCGGGKERPDATSTWVLDDLWRSAVEEISGYTKPKRWPTRVPELSPDKGLQPQALKATYIAALKKRPQFWYDPKMNADEKQKAGAAHKARTGECGRCGGSKLDLGLLDPCPWC
jgi:hypothetical protein